MTDNASNPSTNTSNNSNNNSTDTLILRVLDKDSSDEIVFKIRHTTSLSRLKQAYCERVKVPQNSMVLLFQNHEIQSDHTPETINMKNNDIILAIKSREQPKPKPPPAIPLPTPSEPAKKDIRSRLRQKLHQKNVKTSSTPEDTPVRTTKPWSEPLFYEITLATKFYEQGNYTQSLVHIEEALRQEPHHHRALEFKCKVNIELKKYDYAHNIVNTLIEYFGDCTDCYVLRGRVLYSKGLYSEAFQDFHKVIHDLDPTLDTVAAYYYIASIHYRKGEWSQTISYLESEPILKILEEYSRYKEQLSSTRAGKLVNDMQELLKQAKDQVANELIQEEEDKKLREKQKKNKKLFSEEDDLPDLNFVELIDVMHELQEKGQWSHKECIELMTLARSLSPDEVDRFFVQALAHLTLVERQKLKSKFEKEKNQYLVLPDGDLSKLHYFQFLIILDDYMDSAAKWRDDDEDEEEEKFEDEWIPGEDDALSKELQTNAQVFLSMEMSRYIERLGEQRINPLLRDDEDPMITMYRSQLTREQWQNSVVEGVKGLTLEEQEKIKIHIETSKKDVEKVFSQDVVEYMISALNNEEEKNDEKVEEKKIEEKEIQKEIVESLYCPNQSGKIKYNKSSILGYGSNGTIVYEGYYDDKKAAIKRLTKEMWDIASKEIDTLIKLDQEESLFTVKYYGKEEDEHFYYLGMELCSETLEDFIQNSMTKDRQFGLFEPSIKLFARFPSLYTFQLIKDLVSGVYFLHTLGIIHNDVKPRNILISKRNRVKIADMGLAKHVVNNEQSFTFNTGSTPFGVWYAPEVLDKSMGQSKTVKVDVFSLGCTIHYILTGGSHPFKIKEGEDCVYNIVNGKFSLESLSHLPEAQDLVEQMLHSNPSKRPTLEKVLEHAFFIEQSKRMEIIVRLSNELEKSSSLISDFESFKNSVFTTNSWKQIVDSRLIELLIKERGYNFTKLRDLLRAMRNVYAHYEMIPVALREEVFCTEGGVAEKVFGYFSQKFPKLFLIVHPFVRRNWNEKSVFQGLIKFAV